MITTLISGLAVGAVYSLVAIGYNLTWLTSKVINFAQGGLMVAAMFLTVGLYNLGTPPVLIFVILAVCGAVLALIEMVIAIRPVMMRGNHGELVTTVGVLTVIEGVILLLVKEDVLRVPFVGPEELIDVQGGRIAPVEIILIVVAIGIGVAAHIWTRKTRSGLAASAISEDRDAARILGVNTMRYSYVAFMASGILAFVIAPIVGPKLYAIAALGSILAVKGFVSLALGGLGSQLGALIAGLAIGVIEAVVVRTAGPNFQNLIVFVIFIVVLMLRPRGLFGEKRERMV